MKKKIYFILTAMIMLMILVCACSDGQKEEYILRETIENNDSDLIESAAQKQTDVGDPIESVAREQTDVETDDEEDQTIALDLNHNSIAEEMRLTDPDDGQRKQLEIWENGELLIDSGSCDSVFLCTLNGMDCLLYYYPNMASGVGMYSYELYNLTDRGRDVIQSNYVNFDISFGSLYHDSFDPEAIAAFMDELNDLLSDSVPLFNSNSKLLGTFEKEGRLYDSLWWLDDREPEFIMDEGKSLAENLKDFQTAMTALREPLVWEQMDGLPITEPLELAFYSGAGAWWTDLTLNPDGSFVGNYNDFDIGVLMVHVCQFHGQFGKVEKCTDNSWMLTLMELEIDTSHSIGEEWDESDGEYTYHYISSKPYGFEDADGTVLKSGAQFILYSPDATGHEPGTELYGAMEFQSWMHKRHGFNSADDILGCWGLQNLETGEGFFDDSDLW